MKIVILKTIRGLVAAYMLLIISGGAYAQIKPVYSLASLVDSAKTHLPILLQKQALVNSAKANIRDTKNSFLPKLNIIDEISIGSSNDVAGSFLPVSGISRGISSGIRQNSNYTAETGNLASVYAEYELVNFGLRSAKVDNAIAYADLQQADFNKEVYALKLQISKLYFNILKNISQLHIDEQNIRRYQSINTVIRALTGSGIKAGVDSSLAKAELSKIQITYNQREGAIRQYVRQLSFLTGINVSQINIDTLRKDGEIATAKLFNKTTDTTNNPFIGYFSKQKSLYQTNQNLVGKSYLPKIIVGGGGWARGSSIKYNDNYSALNTGLGLQRYNYIAGIGVTYDLFNITHRRDKLAVTRYQTQAAGYELEQQKLALNNAVAQADEAIITAQKNLAELPIQLQAAKNAYEQKAAQYKVGIINLIDLTTASFVLYSAQLIYAETLNDWYVANLDKAASTGNLDQFIQILKN